MDSNNERRNILPPSSPHDSVVTMIKCPDCGRLVPEPNMAIHLAHACQARKRPARRFEEQEVRGEPMDIEVDQVVRNLTSSPPNAFAASSASVSSQEDSDHVMNQEPPHNPEFTAAAVAHPGTASPGCDAWGSITSSIRELGRNLSSLSPIRTSASTNNEASKRAASVSSFPGQRRQAQYHQRSNDRYVEGHEVIELLNDDDSNEWSCPQCTLRNPNTRTVCDACMYHNATQARPADPYRRERLVDPTRQYDSRSAPSLMSGGAILGGVLGATGAYLRGQPVGTAALNGAMGGAMGGAILGEVMRDNHVAPVPNPYASHNRPTAGGGRPRTSGSSGTARIITRRGPNGTMTTTIVSGNNGVPDAAAMDMMLRNILLSHQLQMGVGNGHDVDRMSYEQLLDAFGDGSENLRAEERDIQQLPSMIITTPENQLSEDKRHCAICLEEFKTGESRKTLPCLHGFHEQCVDQWLRSNGSCPICKHRIGSANQRG